MADSKNIDDGGLAFPGKRWQQVGTVADFGFSDDDSPTFDHVDHPGMSLRDWFAGKFLAGAAASPTSDVALDADPSDQSDVDRALREHWDCAARAAYIAADAMIAARKGGA
jgi:hypothetical protein